MKNNLLKGSQLNHIQKKYLKRFSLNFILLSLALFIWENSFLFKATSQQLEKLSIDFRYQKFMPERNPSQDIIFIDIDDQSLNSLNDRLGRWPWSREVISNAIEYIQQGNPKAVLLDILFSENDKNHPEKDEHLAKTIANFKNVSFALSFENFEGNKADRLPASQTSFAIDIQNYKFKANKYYLSYTKPFSPLWENLSHVHVVNATKDNDGLFRFTPLFFEYNSEIFPSLTLKAVSQFLKKPSYILAGKSLIIKDNNEVKYNIPLDADLKFHMHFYQRKDQFKTLKFDNVYQSSLDLLQGNISDPETFEKELKSNFENKIVLIGGSATGLQDLKVTPIDKDYPGALLHAVAISNILNNNYLKVLPSAYNFVFALLFIVLIYSSFTFINNVFIKNSLPFIIMGGYAFISFYLFKNNEMQLPLATPLIFGFLSYGDGLAYLTFVESKQKKKIMGTLSKYLSPQVTAQLVEQGVDPTAEVGHKQELSILFSDVRDFTTMSEKIKAEQVVEMLNYYLARMTDIVFSNKGTLDKFIGDAVMSFWGAPIADDKHALNAVISALNMRHQLKEINKHFMSQYGMEFHIGIGINTGEVIVGNIGSDKRLDYTVIGDNVNLASRLEGLTKNYSLELIIGERTYLLVHEFVLCRPIDWVLVKGKKEPTRIFEPLALKTNATEKDYDLLELYSLGLEQYKMGQFSTAKSHFIAIYEKYKDGPSKVMLDRCDYLMQTPPDNWTGIFKFTSK